MRKIFAKKNLLYALYLFVVTFLLLEIILRIYNPFHFRIKGDRIVLDTNKTYEVDNRDIPVLDKTILHRRNGLGFRGPEKPAGFNRYLSLLTVGGSTTECTYLTEGKTWSDRLTAYLQQSFDSIWLNNAGLAGHSTYGHIILVQDYLVKLHPKMILFLVGCNDIDRDDLNASEKSNSSDHYASFLTFLTKNSEVCSLAANLLRSRRARIKNLHDTWLNLRAHNDTLVLSAAAIEQHLSYEQKYLAGYRARLQTLADACIKNNIRPVFITQPSLAGAGADPVTGTDLEKIKLSGPYNGLLWWKTQQLYNDVTREVAGRNKLLLIDLANEMPKSSVYFYDMIHFTNAGADKVGALIYTDLKSYLGQQYPQFLEK